MPQDPIRPAMPPKAFRGAAAAKFAGPSESQMQEQWDSPYGDESAKQELLQVVGGRPEYIREKWKDLPRHIRTKITEYERLTGAWDGMQAAGQVRPEPKLAAGWEPPERPGQCDDCHRNNQPLEKVGGRDLCPKCRQAFSASKMAAAAPAAPKFAVEWNGDGNGWDVAEKEPGGMSPPAVFPTRAEAERFLQKMKQDMKRDPDTYGTGEGVSLRVRELTPQEAKGLGLQARKPDVALAAEQPIRPAPKLSGTQFAPADPDNPKCCYCGKPAAIWFGPSDQAACSACAELKNCPEPWDYI